jgi:uncharacterized protein (DUF924 family)
MEPAEVLTFWRQAGPALWFAKDPDFGRRFAVRFAFAYRRAATGSLSLWQQVPAGALALAILLGRYPRSAFHGRPDMYATDSEARAVSLLAIRRGADRIVGSGLRAFFYLPLSACENLADQDRAVALSEPLGEPYARRARERREIIRRFGRFPHRNAILGRTSTEEETAWLTAAETVG